MSKFNTKSVATFKGRTVNLAGGSAFTVDKKFEIISILLTSMVQDQYYRKADKTINRLSELISTCSDKEFVAKAAVFARKEFGMRSITHVVAGQLARVMSGSKTEPWLKDFFASIVKRPDDVTEIVSYYKSVSGHPEKIVPIPNSLKKGLARAIESFDSYQLGKYKASKSDVSLVDVVNVVHPKSNEGLTSLVNGTLKSTDTWESMLVQAGTSDNPKEAKAEVWRDLVSRRKIGYFALLRSMKKIVEQSPDTVDAACELLLDESMIKKSLVLPFRYQTAINEIKKEKDSKLYRKVLVALNGALDISVNNVPELDGDTVVVVDASGSMSGRPIEIASLFAAILAKKNMSDIILFDYSSKMLSYNPGDTVSSIANQIMMSASGGATNFDCIFDSTNKKYDRIVIFSDMQGWAGSNRPDKRFREYQARFNVKPFVHSVDLQGYGTIQFPEDKVCTSAGFSEKIFDIMKIVESDKNVLIDHIQNINFSDYLEDSQVN